MAEIKYRYCNCGDGDVAKYPLHEAIFKNDIETVKELLKTIPIETVDCGFNTPLMVALKCKNTQAAVFIRIVIIILGDLNTKWCKYSCK